MENNYREINKFERNKRPRLLSGVMLLAAGFILLAYKMGAPIPAWVFTWPVLLIVIGTYLGIKSRFHNPGSFIMMTIGFIFLIDQSRPDLNFHNYIIPVILICVGFIYILRPRHNFHSSLRNRKDNHINYPNASPAGYSLENFAEENKNIASEEDGEYVDINAVLGGVKKIILSKNFKGGEINCFMGGTEINLLQADIQSPVILDLNNVFGGTKLIVPSNWDVKNEVSAVFGGIEDKRHVNSAMPDVNKILVLKGNCVFGGIEVTNF